MKLEEKMTRRSFLKRLKQLGLLLVTSSSFSYFYSRYIEPKNLEVTYHDLTSRKIPISFDGIKIIQFSDTHIGHNYSLDQLESLVRIINDQQPDIVLFTGDLIDEPNKYTEGDQLPPILKKITAPLGKVAIYGNHDHGGYGTEIYSEIMKKSGFTLLLNDSVQIHSPNSDESIFIAGLDDLILGRPSIEDTFHHVQEDLYTILLAHEPDIIDRLIHLPFSTQLSGHSHGGQVKIPFFGPLITPPGATNYYEGLYPFAEQQKLLYVNRGIGTTRMPYRFLSPPELTVFTLRRQE